MFLVLKVDGYRGFHFMMMYTVVEATIMGLAPSFWDCPISSLGLEHSSIRNTALYQPQILLIRGKISPF